MTLTLATLDGCDVERHKLRPFPSPSSTPGHQSHHKLEIEAFNKFLLEHLHIMTSTLTKLSRVPSGSPAPSSSTDVDSIRKAFESLTTVANSDSMKAAIGVINETYSLRAQLKTKDTEILGLQQKLEIQKERNIVAIKEVSAALELETSKQKDAEARNESLQRDLAEGKAKLKEASDRSLALDKRIGALQTRNRDTEESLKNARREIEVQKEKLNDQKSDIEVLKATKLSLDEAIASEKRRSANLESRHQDVNKKLESVESELKSIQGFCMRRDIPKKDM